MDLAECIIRWLVIKKCEILEFTSVTLLINWQFEMQLATAHAAIAAAFRIMQGCMAKAQKEQIWNHFPTAQLPF
jgi:hypothetical protein